ncbi:hypothetical protein FG93_06053 [Bosea sp. LC85]|nr:hypothetical protein FG93_06053 [Bosea sp. LC85]
MQTRKGWIIGLRSRSRAAGRPTIRDLVRNGTGPVADRVLPMAAAAQSVAERSAESSSIIGRSHSSARAGLSAI